MKNNLPEVASPIQHPVIGKKFTPAKHPNDRVKLAYAKRHVDDRMSEEMDDDSYLYAAGGDATSAAYDVMLNYRGLDRLSISYRYLIGREIDSD